MKRRIFLKQNARITLGFLGIYALANGCVSEGSNRRYVEEAPDPMLHPGYGPLQPDPEGLINLPKDFSYSIISRKGELMSDGFYVPGLPDGMASFPTPDNKVILIRNHEISPNDRQAGPFGNSMQLFHKIAPEQLYDYGRGRMPCLGGTTTMIYNPASGEVELEYLSLAGTIRNCAGGATPWQSWITCEENTATAGLRLEKDHGYNFEVAASVTPQLADPVPIKAMGRFNHESICVDPRTGIVYQTEDRPDGLIYRYLPKTPGRLQAGGKLQILAIKDQKSFDTRNWQELDCEPMPIGQPYEVEWLDIDDVEAPEDDLRYRGFDQGAARFARGEGMWFGEKELYFACTNGGKFRQGQILRYTPSEKEGQPEESDQPGTVEIFVEPNNTNLMQSADNLTIAANGDVIICEDVPTPRIVGVTPDGRIYHIAKNVGFLSEFAGGVFSPDGQTYFVNIQNAGLTVAITGPWGQRALAG